MTDNSILPSRHNSRPLSNLFSKVSKRDHNPASKREKLTPMACTFESRVTMARSSTLYGQRIVAHAATLIQQIALSVSPKSGRAVPCIHAGWTSPFAVTEIKYTRGGMNMKRAWPAVESLATGEVGRRMTLPPFAADRRAARIWMARTAAWNVTSVKRTTASVKRSVGS